MTYAVGFFGSLSEAATLGRINTEEHKRLFDEQRTESVFWKREAPLLSLWGNGGGTLLSRYVHGHARGATGAQSGSDETGRYLSFAVVLRIRCSRVVT